VLSSTSSSKDRIGEVRLGRAWLLAAVGVVALLTPWELHWRAAGFEPNLRDSARLWATLRKRASRQGPAAIVLVGASRMQLDVALDVAEEIAGRRPIQLAIDGTSPMPVLRDLAEDESFCGTVICSVEVRALVRGGREAPERYLAQYREMGPSDEIETRLSALVQGSFASTSPGLSPVEVAQKVLGGDSPKPPYAPLQPDRSRAADYTMTDVEKHRAFRVEAVRAAAARGAVPFPAFQASCAELEDLVERIQGRGGRVILVRLPTSGEHWETGERLHPKDEYWAYLAGSTQAQTVHFKDYPALDRFDCPDTSHLDGRDAPEFTRALFDMLFRGQ